MKNDEILDSGKGYKIFLTYEDSDMNHDEIKNVIICCHGFASSRNNGLFQDLMQESKKYGISVITFDFQGHGDSSENIGNLTVQNCIEDLERVEEYVRQCFPNASINILANSFGAYITLLKLKQDKEQNIEPIESSIVLKAPAVNMSEILTNVLLKEPFDEYKTRGEAKVGKKEVILPYSFYEDLCSHSVMDFEVPIPVTIYQGKNDETASIQDTEKFAENNPKVEINKLEGEGHSFSSKSEELVIQSSIRHAIIKDYENIKKIQLPKSCSELTSDEIELAKARKLQILMAPFFARDYDFFYQPNNYSLKRKIYNRPVKLEAGKEKNTIVCKTLVDLACEILKENEIEARPITCDDDEFSHIDLEITTKSGKKYIINFLSDLELTQMGCKPKRFASSEYLEERYSDKKDKYSCLEEEKLKEIDKKLNFLVYDMYLNDAIALMKSEFDNYPQILQSSKEESDKKRERRLKKLKPIDTAKMKVDFIMKYFNYRGNIRSQIELIRYYKMLIGELLTKEEQKCVKLLNSHIKKSNGEYEYLRPIFDELYEDSDDKWRFLIISVGKKHYAVSCKEKSYVQFNQSEMKEKIDKGEISIAQKKKSILGEFIRNMGKNVRLVKHPVVQEEICRYEVLIDRAKEKDTKFDTEKICQDIFLEVFCFSDDGNILKIKNKDGVMVDFYFDGDTLISETPTQIVQYVYDEETENFSPSIINVSKNPIDVDFHDE